MFRLSCFHMSNMSAKQRKTVQISSEPLQNTTEDCLETQDLNSHSSPLVSDSSNNTMVEQRFVENFDDHDKETESKYSIDRDILVGITKSCSLGSFLGRNQSDNDIAYEDDLKKSYSVGSRDICSTPVLTVGEDLGGLHGQFPENFEVVNHGSFSTVGYAQELENSGHGDRDASDCFQWDDLSSKDFTKKRIEEWVIDIQQCSHFEELSDLSAPEIIEIEKHGNSLDISYARKEDSKVNSPGMEAAMKYISSLTANASSAQLINLGLVTIPFLSPFSSLRALNLSGNAIVRIIAGALPRGLHVLNLSKNNIATIEGLRDLIRLRVLDLSYNRILRIGHGLACCSSLKELYLGVNKISEVEGLHRLLKLNILDLRFNKISTTKCLGQLTCNYLSLQVINLEGNLSQRNVGDEQLKKYLLGLLPHLAYFNKQPIKTGNPKDTVQRSARITGNPKDNTVQRSARITGNPKDTVQRSARITGNPKDTVQRSARITGNPKDTVQRSARIGINGHHHQNKTGSGSLSIHGRRSQQIASTSSTTKPK